MPTFTEHPPQQPYTGDLAYDTRIERARRQAESDGRLRYVTSGKDGRVSYFKKRDCICVGARDWAVIKGGCWHYRRYEEVRAMRSEP